MIENLLDRRSDWNVMWSMVFGVACDDTFDALNFLDIAPQEPLGFGFSQASITSNVLLTSMGHHYLSPS